MIGFTAEVSREPTIMVGVAGAFKYGGTAASFITHPSHGLALYLRGRTGDNFRGTVAGNRAAMQVAFAGNGFHRQISH